MVIKVDGKKLFKAAMCEYGVNKNDLAKEIGVSLSLIRGMFSNRTTISKKNALKITNMFNIDFSDFFSMVEQSELVIQSDKFRMRFDAYKLSTMLFKAGESKKSICNKLSVTKACLSKMFRNGFLTQPKHVKILCVVLNFEFDDVFEIVTDSKKSNNKEQIFVLKSDVLKDLMNLNNHNQASLAEALNIHFSSVSSYLYDRKRTPRIELAHRICKLFDVDFDYLFEVVEK